MWDDDTRYAVIRGRDSRYDGYFVTAVLSTGIYCRPSCPARTPRRDRVTFYPTAAGAQQAGFRSCRRCLPDAAPGSPQWKIGEDLASRAMRLIDDGVVEREGVAGLAKHLRYTPRHLGRILADELGASPLALAVAHRLHHARALLESTDLAMVEVAYGSGFGSVRQFNDSARAAWDLTPSQVRGRRSRIAAHTGSLTRIEVRLRHREPSDIPRVIEFLRPRCIDGVEEVDSGTYARAVTLPHGRGIVRLTPAAGHVRAVLDLEDPRDTAAAVARSRRLLDLDADPVAVDALLSADATLAPVVAAAPGLRVPGAMEPFETVVRAIAGQQISVAGAIRALSAITERWGGSLHDGERVWRTFPTPRALADVDPAVGIVPRARWTTMSAIAKALSNGSLDLGPGTDRREARRVLLSTVGIGPWTAEYVAMRALGDPDAFPAGDLVLRKALSLDERQLGAASENWRPWRAYAAMHIWTAATEGRLP
jgi:AraC family transcriptional regulator of adaptative response / DNA-3-methyladenine glycosylase II